MRCAHCHTPTTPDAKSITRPAPRILRWMGIEAVTVRMHDGCWDAHLAWRRA